ncbi:MAG: 2-hydroxyacid dehydrogenase [Actinomycetes bacterium]
MAPAVSDRTQPGDYGGFVALVWLPEDDWPQHLRLPAELTVEVWRSGMPVPSSIRQVEFYVPEYLGPASVIEITHEMPSLRVIQTLTAGYDDYLAALGQLRPGVKLCNAAGVHDASTSELAVGLALASLRGFVGFVRAQDEGAWLHARHDSLADRRVMLVGVGSVGSAIARRLEPFEVDLTLVGRSARPGVRASAELASLLPAAEVVILAVPYSDATHHLVDREFLAAMPDGALLVNVSRGAVVDTDALLPELEAGRLRAALDVTDPEPLPAEHPLWRAPNVLISPHVGGDTTAFLPRAWALLQSQLDTFAAGDRLANLVAG